MKRTNVQHVGGNKTGSCVIYVIPQEKNSNHFKVDLNFFYLAWLKTGADMKLVNKQSVSMATSTPEYAN